MFYEVTYMRNGYQLSDVFRPDSRWGKRIFRVQVATLPDHTDNEIVQAARVDVPVGYWLHRILAIGGDPHERKLFFKPIVAVKQAVTEPA
ncbi:MULTISPECIES: hypothetical protein [unclassified Janthinobacterium]|uniref:hypothetical protein n=1 Tax=unclassified Janthinobacterium TaxID=2610881 RepID=UPI0012F9B15E|nr:MULTISPECIES: hypothetical protein [unclassified Janthinobacterium]MEC5159579.1 hypothetical protein [Janthinobacterium sp. CG_S6]